MKIDYHQELEQELARTLQEEIDWEVLSSILEEMGWTRVTLENKFLPVSLVELHRWREENLKGQWKGHGGEWMFEKAEDATVFALRWM